MQMISIEYILECMNDEKNYLGDLWQTCLNNKKRFKKSKLKEILKKISFYFKNFSLFFKFDTFAIAITNCIF